jgi:hypothetical protein
VDSLMDGTFRKAAHPEQAFFEFVQIPFEMAFHLRPHPPAIKKS